MNRHTVAGVSFSIAETGGYWLNVNGAHVHLTHPEALAIITRMTSLTGGHEWAVRTISGGISPMPEGEHYARDYVTSGPAGRALLNRWVTEWVEVTDVPQDR